MAEEESPKVLVYDGSTSSRNDVLTYTVREGLTNELVYKFFVEAINAVGSSGLSNPLVVLAAIVPTAPYNLTVVSTDTGSVLLEWNPPLDTRGSVLTGFYVYYGKLVSLATDTTAWSKTAIISHSVTQYNLIGLDQDEEYRIKMTAENVRGESEFSDSLNQFASAVPTNLATPSLVVGSRTTDAMTIAFTVPGTSTVEVLGYRLYVNDPDSRAVPSRLVYDGEAINSVLNARVTGLES